MKTTSGNLSTLSVCRFFLYSLAHVISFLLELLAKSLFLSPGGSVPRPQQPCFLLCGSECECQSSPVLTSPPSLKTHIHSSYSLIFPAAPVSLQRLITAVYRHCKKCPSVHCLKFFPVLQMFLLPPDQTTL